MFFDRGLLFACFIAVLTHQATSQSFGFLACPYIDNALAVNLTKYIDRPWFYIYYFRNIIEAGDKCSKEVLLLNSDGSVAKTTYAVRDGQPREITGRAVINAAGNGGNLTINADFYGFKCKF